MEFYTVAILTATMLLQHYSLYTVYILMAGSVKSSTVFPAPFALLTASQLVLYQLQHLNTVGLLDLSLAVCSSCISHSCFLFSVYPNFVQHLHRKTVCCDVFVFIVFIGLPIVALAIGLSCKGKVSLVFSLCWNVHVSYVNSHIKIVSLCKQHPENKKLWLDVYHWYTAVLIYCIA